MKRHKKYWKKRRKTFFDVNVEPVAQGTVDLIVNGRMKRQEVAEGDEEDGVGMALGILVTGDIEEEGEGEEEVEVEA